MFILFGTRRMNKVLKQGIYKTCPICDSSSFSIMHTWSWFTLFFIPVFPISSKDYIFVCERCNNGFKVNKDEALIHASS